MKVEFKFELGDQVKNKHGRVGFVDSLSVNSDSPNRAFIEYEDSKQNRWENEDKLEKVQKDN